MKTDIVGVGVSEVTVSSPHNTGRLTERTVLPLPPSPGEEAHFEMEVYSRFMRCLRQVPHNRTDIKILASIQFTSDYLDSSDAMIARILVDLGLRAPRLAFPAAFLDFADRAMMRIAWDEGAPAGSLMALREHWDRIGEDRFMDAARNHYAMASYRAYATA